MIVNRLEVPRTMVIRPAVDPTPAQPWDWSELTHLVHGKRSSYEHGCHCDECTAAATRRMAARRAATGRR